MSFINPKTGRLTEIEEESISRTYFNSCGTSVMTEFLPMGEILDPPKDIHAVLSILNDKYFFHIMVGKRGEVFDPTNKETGMASKNRRMGDKYWKFREVSRPTFDIYIKFLKTKNPRFLRAVEQRKNINAYENVNPTKAELSLDTKYNSDIHKIK